MQECNLSGCKCDIDGKEMCCKECPGYTFCKFVCEEALAE